MGAPFDLDQLLGTVGIPEAPQERKSCCAALYRLEPVRLLLGDTLHPGGLALTHRLGKLVGIERDNLVLDAACGNGASSFAVARSFHCRVVGVDLGWESVAEATRMAAESNMDGQVSFIAGDGESLPLGDGTFHAALCECSMSLFPDKAMGVAEIGRLLRSGGRLGVSDFTVESSCLPEELMGPLGQALCLADAPPVQGYRDLLAGGGLSLIHEEDASDSILKLLGDIEAKLAAFRMLLSDSGPPSGGSDLLSQALSLVEKVGVLARDGGIGYRLFVAEKLG